MSWDNPVFPKAAKNSIGFFVPFFLSYPWVVGGSVKEESAYFYSINQGFDAEVA